MRRTNVILLLLALSFFVAGVAEPLMGTPSPAYSPAAFIHAVVVGLLCYAWCRADALARGSIPPGRSALMAGLLPPVGIPLYLFRTRQSLPALAATAVALLFLFGASLLLTAGLWIGAGLAR